MGLLLQNVEEAAAEQLIDPVAPVSSGRATTSNRLLSRWLGLAAGMTIFGLCQWGLVAGLARIGTPADVGVFTYGLALTSPFMLLAAMGVGTVVATDVRCNRPIGDYISASCAALIIGFLAAVVSAILLGQQAAGLSVVAAVAVAKLFDSVSSGIYGAFQLAGRLHWMSISRVLQGVLQLATLLVAYKATGSLVVATWSFSLMSAAVTIFYDVRMLKRVRRPCPTVAWPLNMRMPIRTILSLWRTSLPLGISACVGVLSLTIPRMFLERTAGARELGVFSGMWTLLLPFALVTMTLNTAVTSPLAASIHANPKRFNRLHGITIVVSVVSGAIAVVAAVTSARPLLTAMYGSEYGQHPDVFVLIMVAAAISYVATALGLPALAARRFMHRPLGDAASLLVSVPACAILIPAVGMRGAALGYLSAMLTLLISMAASTLVVRKRYMGADSTRD